MCICEFRPSVRSFVRPSASHPHTRSSVHPLTTPQSSVPYYSVIYILPNVFVFMFYTRIYCVTRMQYTHIHIYEQYTCVYFDLCKPFIVHPALAAHYLVFYMTSDLIRLCSTQLFHSVPPPPFL